MNYNLPLQVKSAESGPSGFRPSKVFASPKQQNKKITKKRVVRCSSRNTYTPVVETTKEDFLEETYIKNLQQQIQFLELELEQQFEQLMN
jgi:hypothetical protein